MPPEIETYSPGGARPVSPLRQAMFARGGGDLDAWLAGMNAVALSFLAIAAGAHLPSATASRFTPPTPPVLSASAMEIELAAEPGPPAAAPAEAQSAAAEPEPEPLAVLPLQEPIAYRELPELIDPVPVVEPERQPNPAVREPPHRAGQTPPASNPGPRRPAANRGPALTPGAPGVSGGVAGGSGTSAQSGTSAGRGTTPQPPYPAFARRDKLQGTVVVSITVNDGAVTAVRIISSSGSPALDQYAVKHVQRRWKWSAGTTRTFTQPFRFVLR